MILHDRMTAWMTSITNTLQTKHALTVFEE
jgi:hypothetical protein